MLPGLAFAAVIAARNEPGPLSLVFVTISGPLARAAGAPSVDPPTQPRVTRRPARIRTDSVRLGKRSLTATRLGSRERGCRERLAAIPLQGPEIRLPRPCCRQSLTQRPERRREGERLQTQPSAAVRLTGKDMQGRSREGR